MTIFCNYISSQLFLSSITELDIFLKLREPSPNVNQGRISKHIQVWSQIKLHSKWQKNTVLALLVL